jgi:hypothetical protein
MIKYQLVCDNAHEFEGWFQSSDMFVQQSDSGMVSCPLCDTTAVRRALMAPNLASPKTRKSGAFPDPDDGSNDGPHAGSNAGSNDGVVPASRDGATPPSAMTGKGMPPEALEKMQALVTEMRILQAKIKTECRDVGSGFAEEARKMHYGEVDPEGIYGEATIEEREQLDEEGIEIFQMPWLSQDN